MYKFNIINTTLINKFLFQLNILVINPQRYYLYLEKCLTNKDQLSFALIYRRNYLIFLRCIH